MKSVQVLVIPTLSLRRRGICFPLRVEILCLQAAAFSQEQTFSTRKKKADSSPASRDRNDKSLISFESGGWGKDRSSPFSCRVNLGRVWSIIGSIMASTNPVSDASGVVSVELSRAHTALYVLLGIQLVGTGAVPCLFSPRLTFV